MNVEWPVIIASLLLGLAGAPHCLGMCGGIACAAGALPGGRTALVLASAYRLVTYACLGVLAGALLHPLARIGAIDAWLRASVGVLMLLAGVTILRARGDAGGLFAGPLLGGLLRLSPVRRLARRVQAAGAGSAALFGIGWGLLPCGMVYGALLLNAAGGSPLSSALGMLAFGVGTLPAVGGAGLALRWLAQRPDLRAVYGTLVLLLGLGTLGQSMAMLSDGATDHAGHSGQQVHDDQPIHLRQHGN